MVIGSETHANVMRAAGVPEGKIVQVKGGEYNAVRRLHHRGLPERPLDGRHQEVRGAGHLVSVPASPPTKVGDLPEGDT